MPRIPASLIRCAYRISPFLPLLLRTCRDLLSARNELRWLREHAIATASRASGVSSSSPRLRWRSLLYKLCVQRARGRPIQYILGNQPFGDLEILCTKGVLIPRQETEAYTARIANILLENSRTEALRATNNSAKISKFRILDLCSGTGCISLLLQNILSRHQPRLEVLGIDVSPKAVALARRNLNHNIELGYIPQVAKEYVGFVKADILSDPGLDEGSWNMVISNPPYISPHSFNKDTSRSVRNYEPKSALVPSDNCSIATGLNSADKDLSIGDSFYPRLLEIAERVDASILLVEVADMEQARRVVVLAVKLGIWDAFEIWRDWPDDKIMSENLIEGASVKVIGNGDGRSVLVRRKERGRILNDREN